MRSDLPGQRFILPIHHLADNLSHILYKDILVSEDEQGRHHPIPLIRSSGYSVESYLRLSIPVCSQSGGKDMVDLITM